MCLAQGPQRSNAGDGMPRHAGDLTFSKVVYDYQQGFSCVNS